MKRRNFLSIMSGAAIAPVLPLRAVQVAASTSAAGGGYARLLYGLSVYHAQVGGAASAVDLMPRLGVTATKAKALVAEMAAKGVVSPAAASSTGMFRLTRRASPTTTSSRLAKWLDRQVVESAPADLETKTEICAEPAQEIENGQV